MPQYISHIKIDETIYPIISNNIYTIQNIQISSNKQISSSHNSIYPYETTITISDLTAKDILSNQYITIWILLIILFLLEYQLIM